MNNQMRHLKKKLDEAIEQTRKIKAAIAAIQEVCEHRWSYKGHGHNDDHYICDECGKDEWR